MAELTLNARGIASSPVPANLGRFQEVCLWTGAEPLEIQRLTLQLEGRKFWQAPLGGRLSSKSSSTRLAIPRAPKRVDRVILRCEEGANRRAFLFGRARARPAKARWTQAWEGWSNLGQAEFPSGASVCEVPVSRDQAREVVRVEASERLECTGARVYFSDNTSLNFNQSFVLVPGTCRDFRLPRARFVIRVVLRCRPARRKLRCRALGVEDRGPIASLPDDSADDLAREDARREREARERREQAEREQAAWEKAERKRAQEERQEARRQAAAREAERERRARQRAEQEAREEARQKAKREAIQRRRREKLAELAAIEAAEAAAREQAAREQEAREKAVREQAARDQAAEEAADRKRNQAERERARRERAARKRAGERREARERAEQAARQKAKREAAEKRRLEKAAELAAIEAAAKAQRDKEAREQAKREKKAREEEARERAARQKAKREEAAREAARQERIERERAKRKREAREQARRDQQARDEARLKREARLKAKRQKEARERESREKAKRDEEAREKREAEQAALQEAAREKAKRDKRQREARQKAKRQKEAREKRETAKRRKTRKWAKRRAWRDLGQAESELGSGTIEVAVRPKRRRVVRVETSERAECLGVTLYLRGGRKIQVNTAFVLEPGKFRDIPCGKEAVEVERVVLRCRPLKRRLACRASGSADDAWTKRWKGWKTASEADVAKGNARVEISVDAKRRRKTVRVESETRLECEGATVYLEDGGSVELKKPFVLDPGAYRDLELGQKRAVARVVLRCKPAPRPTRCRALEAEAEDDAARDKRKPDSSQRGKSTKSKADKKPPRSGRGKSSKSDERDDQRGRSR